MQFESANEDNVRKIEGLVSQRRLGEAIALCQAWAAGRPTDHVPWSWLGFACILAGNWPAAERALCEAVRLQPGDPHYWTNLGIAVRNQGRPAEAESHSRRALAIDARDPIHLSNLGSCLADQNRLSEACDAFSLALNENPNHLASLSNLAWLNQRLGNLSEAQNLFNRYLAIAPNDIEVAARHACLLVQRGQHQVGIEQLLRLLEESPHSPHVWISLADSYRLVGDLARAELAYRRALEVQPQSLDAAIGLTLVLISQCSFAEAEEILLGVLKSHPTRADAWVARGALHHARAEIDAAISATRRALALAPNSTVHSTLLQDLQYADGVEPQGLLNAHRQWNDTYARSLTPSNPPRRANRGALRIGFVSENFSRHPIAFFVLPALESLDKTHCSVTCYSDGFTRDEYTARFQAASSTWRDTKHLSDEEFAELIRRDQIDMLVDLMGHFGRRLLVFARKPAPLQLTWCGYASTTGLSTIDFLLADRFHIRDGEEANYSESVLRLPHDHICYQPPANVSAVSLLPSLNQRQFTFGCFNAPHKYNAGMLDAWCIILRRVPNSGLILKYRGLGHRELNQKLRGEFYKRGMSAEQITIEEGSKSQGLLDDYKRIDLALDTQPYSGALTTCEALWMGVPVITYPGKTFAGRQSVSHLTNAGYPYFIASDLAGYIELAVSWATRREELAAIRQEMRETVLASPLCDAARFAQDFLALLQFAWTLDE